MKKEWKKNEKRMKKEWKKNEKRMKKEWKKNEKRMKKEWKKPRLGGIAHSTGARLIAKRVKDTSCLLHDTYYNDQQLECGTRPDDFAGLAEVLAIRWQKHKIKGQLPVEAWTKWYTPKPAKCPEVAATIWTWVSLQIKIRACNPW